MSEEIWRWWNDASIHVATWPTTNDCVAGCATTDDFEQQLDAVCAVLGAIRRAKTEAKVSQRAEVATLVVTASDDALRAVSATFGDLVFAGSIRSSELVANSGSTEIVTDVTLVPVEPAPA